MKKDVFLAFRKLFVNLTEKLLLIIIYLPFFLFPDYFLYTFFFFKSSCWNFFLSFTLGVVSTYKFVYHWEESFLFNCLFDFGTFSDFLFFFYLFKVSSSSFSRTLLESLKGKQIFMCRNR